MAIAWQQKTTDMWQWQGNRRLLKDGNRMATEDYWWHAQGNRRLLKGAKRNKIQHNLAKNIAQN